MASSAFSRGINTLKPFSDIFHKSEIKINDEPTVIFGTMPSRLHVRIHEIADNAITDGVSTLPFFPSSSKDIASSNNDNNNDNDAKEEGGDERLRKRIRKAYGHNLDKLEAYTMRNVFSIRSVTAAVPVPKTARTRMIEMYLRDDSDYHFGDNGAERNNNDSHDPHDDVSHENTENDTPLNRIYAQGDIPSSGELSFVDDEIRKLQKTLLEKTLLKKELIGQLKDVSRAETAVRGIKRVLCKKKINATQAESTDQIHLKSNAALMGKEGLKQLNEQARRLTKRVRVELEQVEEEETVDMPPVSFKQKKLTMKEEYNVHVKRTCCTQTNVAK